MFRCPITYEEFTSKYSKSGLKLISRNLVSLNDLELTGEELLDEAINRAPKMSIQGVQPKLSAIVKIKEEKFSIVDQGGKYILKPQNNHYKELPENEDLTMRLAKSIGLEIPLHGLVYAADDSLVYFIKRFDRYSKTKKYAVEDFAQLSGAKRDTKYKSSMEKVVKIVNEFCTFPVIEKRKLFKVVIFNFLIGNEDMHLKNFSLIRKDNKIQFSPFYDLVNTTIAIKNTIEEIALPLKGKKNNLIRKNFIKDFGEELLELNTKTINDVISNIIDKITFWFELIEVSFLSDDLKEKYKELLSERARRLELF